MGFIRGVAQIAGLGRPSYLDNRLYVDGALQHQRAQIRAMYDEPKEQQRQAEAAAKEAQRQHEAVVKARSAELAEAEKAAWAQWAIPPRFTGGHADDPLIVTHHRAGRVPVIVMPPAAAVAAGDNALANGAEELVRANRDLVNDEKFMESARVADSLYPEVRNSYGPLLARLRSEQWWQKLTVAAGVADKSTEPHLWQGQYTSGKETVTTYTVPSIHSIRVAADGLRIRISPQFGVTAERWRKVLPELRVAFKAAGAPASEMTITEDRGGGVVLRLNDSDPLEGVVPETGCWDDDKMRSLLGIDSQGREVWINWSNTSGMVVGGLAGSGKTASMLPAFRHFEGNAELYIFDGKAQRDLHPLRHICRVYDNSGDIAGPLKTLQMLERLRVLRGDAIYEKLGAANFWHLNREQRRQLGMKPIFVILDECQVWLKLSKNKDTAKIQAAILEAVENLIRMGRSAGIVVVITTQRPSAVSIPTDVRDNAQLKLCFKVTDSTMATMVLGSAPQGALDPAAIPAGKKGRFVMDTEGAGMVLGQAGYIKPDELESLLANSSPVPDQWQVAEAFAGGLRSGMTRPEGAAAPASTSPAPTLTVVPDPAPAPAATDPIAALIPSPEEISRMTVEQRLEVMRLVAQIKGGAAPEVEVPVELVEVPAPEPEPAEPPRRTRAAKPAEPAAEETPPLARPAANSTPDF